MNFPWQVFPWNCAWSVSPACWQWRKTNSIQFHLGKSFHIIVWIGPKSIEVLGVRQSFPCRSFCVRDFDPLYRMLPCHYPLVPEVFSRAQRDASWPKPVSGTQLYPVIKHFYLTVAKVILCHSHATSLYLNTCYAIYNLQCRIERAILCESGAKYFMRDWKTRKTVSLLKSPSTCIWPVHDKVSLSFFPV